MGTNDLIRKAIVYGGNMGARMIANAPKLQSLKLKDLNPKLGHPYTALAFTVWDLAFDNIPYLKNSLANKLAKGAGAAYFGALACADIVHFINGNWENWYNFPFNISMAASLGYDLKELSK